MKARDIMTSHPVVLTQREPAIRAAEIMRDHDVNLVPIVDDPSSMCLIGVITDHDIAVRGIAGEHRPRRTVAELMTVNNLCTVSTDDDVADISALMERHQLRCIPVISHGHRLVGVITQANLSAAITGVVPSSNRRPDPHAVDTGRSGRRPESST